jgi:iodotyrosine deiodinase
MNDRPTIPLPDVRRLSDTDMLRRADGFRDLMQSRRTVRDFDARPVPRPVIEACIAAAGTAPSGANQQPWHFVAVSDPDVKRRIREAAEAEEREFYERRAPEEWLDALQAVRHGLA